jgi:pyruvate ferredoxin oxidoreductase gamma subunit
MVRHIRFHGRGGEGVKLACRIVSRAGFLTGFTVQDSPLYGAERRGAPVVAFARLSEGPILERGYIAEPDAVVVMDDTLLGQPDAAVLDGLDASTLLLVNSARGEAEIRSRCAAELQPLVLDITSIALDLLGARLLSAPVAGAVAKACRLAPWDTVAAAVRAELADVGVSGEALQRNLDATRRAYDLAPAVGLAERRRPPRRPAVNGFVLPLLPARSSSPAIDAQANAAQRHMEGWRIFRPEIDLAHCTRCFLCFALCPEGAVQLDENNYPVIDYQHCKGCLICAEECPTETIHERREEAS